ncbi:MAG: hypothetical protein GKR99_14100 [Rhodobacteraceae bacterium]|nr:hypothetical protein [Paracoccaceae bacterium]
MPRRTLKHRAIRAAIPLRRRKSVITTVSANKVTLQIGDRTWFVEVDRDLPPFKTYDFVAWIAGALSLQKGLPLRLDLPVSQGTALSLARTSALWMVRMPGDCHPMNLELCNIVPDPPQPETGGILCLSGGVDSTYAAIEASRERAYSHGVLLHGMDIHFTDSQAFAGRRERVARIAQYFGLDLMTVRTNIPASFRPSKSFLPMLLNCILFYAGNGLSRGGFAADNTPDYGLMIEPEANILGVETYFQSPSFAIDYLGWAQTRAEKLAAIHACSPALLADLCVCQLPRPDGGNCGECEKCMRNRLALEICGLDQRLTFPDQRDTIGFYEDLTRSDPVLARLGMLQTEQLGLALPEGEDRRRLLARAEDLRKRHIGHRAP